MKTIEIAHASLMLIRDVPARLVVSAGSWEHQRRMLPAVTDPRRSSLVLGEKT